MDDQILGRNQRSKWANIKQGLQLIFLLAVCVWLLYQINQSSDKTERFGGQIKILEEYGVVLLGRKGTPSSWLNQITLPNSGNVNFKGDSGKIQVKSRTESDQKEQGNVKYSKKLVSISDFRSANDDKEAEVQAREPLTDVQFRKKAIIDGIHSFHDENGVPPEGNETEAADNISSFTFSKETRFGEINIHEIGISGDVNYAEFNSESVTLADTSGIIDYNLETSAGDSSVL